MGMFNSSWFQRDEVAPPGVSPTGMDTAPAAIGVQDSPPPVEPELAREPLWVIYASETGVAEHLAQDASRALQDAGVASRLLSFDQLKLDTLQGIGSALLLVSTCYDGDPPDMAEEFFREHMQQPASLSRLGYGMLALGDSYYDEFCGFGRRLKHWLQASGAHAANLLGLSDQVLVRLTFLTDGRSRRV